MLACTLVDQPRLALSGSFNLGLGARTRPSSPTPCAVVLATIDICIQIKTRDFNKAIYKHMLSIKYLGLNS
jgi:hypothetical protein